jgi:hypothetical protein
MAVDCNLKEILSKYSIKSIIYSTEFYSNMMTGTTSRNNNKLRALLGSLKMILHKTYLQQILKQSYIHQIWGPV